MQPRRFVYIVKSLEHATTFYVGVTSDPVARLARNAGLTVSTLKHRPWKHLAVIEFDEEEPAANPPAAIFGRRRTQ